MKSEKQVLLDYYYCVMWCEFSNMDALYEDYIIHMIGTVGLNILIDNGRLESCGVVNGRKLYTLDKTYLGNKKGEIV